MTNTIREAQALDADKRDRERAREHARHTVERGRPLAQAFTADRLEWAFAGHETDLAALHQLERRKRAERHERAEQASRLHELHAETTRLLREWDRAAEAERRDKAEAEARRRLGWDNA